MTKSFKSFFVKEDSESEATDFKKKNGPPEKTVVTRDTNSTPSIQDINSISNNNSITTPISSAPVDATASGKASFVQFFHDQISNSPAIGHYLEFINALKEVEGLALDEKTKFTTIYASFKAQKVSVDELITAAKKYQDLCTQKKNELDGGYQQGVAQRDQNIKKLTEENASIDKQMQDLNTRKLQNSEKIKGISDEKSKLDGKKADYTSAYTEVNEGIQSNIDKIAQHLSAPTIKANQ
jgi:hypothetical protein